MAEANSQVMAACREIIRLIGQQNLQSGETLPKQEDLRGLLQFSHNSLTPAMNLLVKAGTVSRTRSVGTVIEDLNLLPAGLWRVGLLSANQPLCPEAIYYTALQAVTLSELHRTGHYTINNYITNGSASGDAPEALPHFKGLGTDAAAGKLDAVISLSHLTSETLAALCAQGIGVAEISSSAAPDIPSVYFADDALVTEGLAELNAAGSKRPVLLAHTQFLQTQQARFLKTAKSLGMSAEVYDYDVKALPAFAATLFMKWQTLPDDLRPDGILSTNDMLTLLLSGHCARANSPLPLVTQSNMQVPLYYASPVIELCYDMYETLAAALSLIERQLRGQPLDSLTITTKPHKRARQIPLS